MCVCVGGGGTISAEGRQYLLADYVRGGQFPLADYVRGDKICGETESAPTPAQIDNITIYTSGTRLSSSSIVSHT